VAWRRNASGLAGAALITLLLLAAPVTYAAFPGANGRIAYNARGIYTANPDGSDARLAVAGSGVSRAAWSPNGARLAYTREAGGAGGCPEVHVANADGSGEARLTGASGCSGSSAPAWSPDGTRIAFISERGGSPAPLGPELYVMNADGSNQLRLTDSAMVEREPAWSPDGTRIAFSGAPSSPPGTEGSHDIYVVGAAGSGLARLTTDADNDRDPDWSPDGAKIAFTREGHIDPAANHPGELDVLSVRPDGTGEAPLVAGAGQASDPAWSPDGRLIAYTFARTFEEAQGLFIRASDGTGSAACVVRFGVFFPAWQPAPTPAPAAQAGQACPESADSPPRAGRTVRVDVVRGSVLVKPKGSDDFAPLGDASLVPVGSSVDASDGTVRVTAAANLRRGTMRGDFDGGRFRITQARKRRTVTQLVLTGGDASVCGNGARRARAAARRIRRLRGNARGRFRTRGRYSSAIVRGSRSRWIMEDRCDGTLTRVARGEVEVEDFTKAEEEPLAERQPDQGGGSGGTEPQQGAAPPPSSPGAVAAPKRKRVRVKRGKSYVAGPGR
jgi:dipeptidyl aminopeptidase/acylaminoacyl peptidase